MTDATRFRCFLVAAPGLEPTVGAELRALAPAVRWRAEPGGWEGWLDALTLAHLVSYSRLADGVRIRLGRFVARTFEDLVAGATRVPWSAWVTAQTTFVVRTTCRQSRLYHSDAVASRVAEVVMARTGATWVPKASEATDASRLFVRIVDDEVEVSLDVLQRPMHHRAGPSSAEARHIGQAPLRESLAAACLWLLDAHQATAVFDPCCGSGSLLLETARAAQGHPLRVLAETCFATAPALRGVYDRLRESLETGIQSPAFAPSPLPSMFGADVNPHEVRACLANVGQLGVVAQVATADVLDRTMAWPSLPSGTLLVCNPPWGRRLGAGTAHRVWLAIGRRVLQTPEISTAAWIGPADCAASLPLPITPLANFDCRGISVGLWRWQRHAS